MRTRTLIAVLSLSWSHLGAPAWAAESPVKAAWKPYWYSGPQFRGYDCAYAKQALDDLLGVIGARNTRSVCRWNSGLSAGWEALSPAAEGVSRKAISGLLERVGGEDWLSGARRGWEAGQEPVIDARWLRGGFNQYMSGSGRACGIYAEVLDYFLDTHPLRDVQYWVSCNGGSGFINVSFEYLAPAQGLGLLSRR